MLADIVKSYIEGEVCGWAGKEIADEKYKEIGSEFIPSQISFQTREIPERMMLFDIEKSVLGKYSETKMQLIGDCVSWGAKHAIEALMCSEILMLGDREKYYEVFSPYLYATGRLWVGKGQIRGVDGSVGSWQAKAVMDYGTIRTVEQDVPTYSENIVKKWAVNKKHAEPYLPHGQKHIVKSASKVKNINDLCNMLANGYPCTVASDVGFTMNQQQDGLHHRQGEWAHQMCFLGYYKGNKCPQHVAVKNSWGNAHGTVLDYLTGQPWPNGYLRISFEDADYMIKSGGETFAYSNFVGFPEQKLDKKLFDLIGD